MTEHRVVGTRPPTASTAAASQRMKTVRQAMTSCEVALAVELRARGIDFTMDVPIEGLERRRVDFAFASARVAVCVDGCFWHGCPKHGTWPTANGAWWRAKIEATRRRDADTDARLRALGWAALRVWEHEAPLDAARRVTEAIDSRDASGTTEEAD